MNETSTLRVVKSKHSHCADLTISIRNTTLDMGDYKQTLSALETVKRNSTVMQ